MLSFILILQRFCLKSVFSHRKPLPIKYMQLLDHGCKRYPSVFHAIRSVNYYAQFDLEIDQFHNLFEFLVHGLSASSQNSILKLHPILISQSTDWQNTHYFPLISDYRHISFRFLLLRSSLHIPHFRPRALHVFMLDCIHCFIHWNTLHGKLCRNLL